MSITSSWRQLDPAAAQAFIKSVASDTESALFVPAVCEVHAMPLSFYESYSLFRIVNRHMIPHLTLDYLSNEESHYYMDGSDQAFQNLNAQGALSLDNNNVLDYLDLYISYVYERGNSLGFIRDPHRTTHKGSASMGSHFSAIKLHHESGIKFNEESSRFKIVTPLLYQGKTIQSRIEITKNGAIHVLAPVTVTFLENLKPTEVIHYRHAHENEIIEQCKDLLATTEAGKKLLQAGLKNDAEIRVLTSPDYQAFITNNLVIYLLMPAAERTAKYMQAIVLAGGLRDAEQIAGGTPHPDPGADEDEYIVINYGKNLDIIREMCKIVEEFESKNIPEPLDALRRLGLESLYSGYKNRVDDKGLLDTYLAALERYGFIKR